MAKNNLMDQREKPEKEVFFPFKTIRAGQRELFYAVWAVLESGENLVAHAPTGLGKTVAALAPAVHYALENNKKVFFLTPKQSQHKIAVETLKFMEEKTRRRIHVCDVISKQAMCPRDLAQLHHISFHHLCSIASATRSCPYLKGDIDEGVDLLLDRIHHVDEAKEVCWDLHLCPHATLLKAAKKASVVICDYNYFFSELRERILEKIGCSLSDVILIVDEAHNLPDRIRAQLSDRLTTNRLRDAYSEIHPIDIQLALHIKLIQEQMEKLFEDKALEDGGKGPEEMNMEKSQLVRMVTRSLKQSIVDPMGFFDFVNKLKNYGTKLAKDQDRETASLHLAEFLEGWMKAGENCSRVLSLKNKAHISFNLLDPAVISTPIFSGVHASVLMSGTLYPPQMFRDILGIPDAVCHIYKSPFPKENKKVIVTQGLTTKYTARSPAMYQRIADTIASIASEIADNLAIFFPSYSFMTTVHDYYEEEGFFWNLYLEKRNMTKREKEMLYNQLFRKSGKKSMIWGVQAGSLSEGFDYEKNILKAVIVVGLPLSPPSQEVNNLVSYYSRKFGSHKGKLYGYTFPALSKVVQAAGRGIRSEKDYGIVVLMDYRFNQNRYRSNFPEGLDFVVTEDPATVCREFLANFR